jgi:hypothetical protein
MVGALANGASQMVEPEAVEVRLAELEASRSAMSFARELESLAAGAARGRLFQLAGRIGLAPMRPAWCLISTSCAPSCSTSPT